MSLTERAEQVSRNKYEVEFDGRPLQLSNLDRVLFPQTGFTKGDLIDFYAAIAPVMLPHLADRPVTLRRFPQGVDSKGFWEKRCPEHRPDWISTAPIYSRSNDETIDYCVIDSAAALVWAANLATIEFHTSLALAAEREKPRYVVFDLDPGPPAGLVECGRVALTIQGTFEEMGLESFAKTSGSKGMQIYLPLNTDVTYEQTKPFANMIARIFEQELPDQVVSKMKKSLRGGKVFIDWSQNVEHKTTVCVYSVRARDTPGVSTPLSWGEVEEIADSGDGKPFDFSPGEVRSRVEEQGDLFAALPELEQELPGL